jgi:septum formation protein
MPVTDVHAAEPVVCLASMSPRRRELLAQIGVPHTVVAAHVDESLLPDESPADYVARLARLKAATVRQRGENLPVLAADTTVVLDGAVYGKPADRAEGLAMLAALAGRTHQVLTAVALVMGAGSGAALRVNCSSVTFRDISREEREAYWATGEPRDKAGGYAIQGYGGVFVAALNGSYSAVMGLPLCETAELLRQAGIRYWIGAAP